MTTIVLNEETARRPLGELPAICRLTREEIEKDLGDLRRRAAADRSGDLTTAQLLERLHRIAPEEPQ